MNSFFKSPSWNDRLHFTLSCLILYAVYLNWYYYDHCVKIFSVVYELIYVNQHVWIDTQKRPKHHKMKRLIHYICSMAIDEKWIAQIWIRQNEYTPSMREALRQAQLLLHGNKNEESLTWHLTFENWILRQSTSWKDSLPLEVLKEKRSSNSMTIINHQFGMECDLLKGTIDANLFQQLETFKAWREGG